MLAYRLVPAAIAITLLAPGCTDPAGPSTADLDSVAFSRLDEPETFRGRIQGNLVAVEPFAPGSDPTCNANFTGDPAAPGPSVTLVDDASADFTHIGRARLVAVSCIDPLSPFSDGTGSIQARNGDRLYIAFSNVALPSATDPTLISVEGRQWVTGGTGRFAGASGMQYCSFTIQLTTPTNGTIAGTCDGGLDYDASDRSRS
jgi:hypothetical protein